VQPPSRRNAAWSATLSNFRPTISAHSNTPPWRRGTGRWSATPWRRGPRRHPRTGQSRPRSRRPSSHALRAE
jgi:hypothetical protein